MSIREATADDYPAVERLVLEAFEPITWLKAQDIKYGPLNGLDWQARWRLRVQKAFAAQIVLLGEVEGALSAVSTSSVDRGISLAYIDILAVACSQQQHGHGREMLKETLHYLRKLGMRYVHLDCLTGNSRANALYESEGFEEVARHIRWFREL
jgi:ribosomal protein S18 acetylase RimI-like enzyme